MFTFLDKSLLIRLGISMSVLTALALLGMLGSVIVAEKTQGAAAAVNQAGSLRMQTYRTAMEMGRPHDDRTVAMTPVIEEFEARLNSERLVSVLPTHELSELRLAYEEIRKEWQSEMRPVVDSYLKGSMSQAAAYELFAQRSKQFVDTIDILVTKIELNAEANIKWLRLFQGSLLMFTLLTIFITMNLLTSDVLRPLGELLRCSNAVRRGDFSMRMSHVGEDELGRLGTAFNTMSEELSKIYSELEARVKTKTRDLERSNRSLELLYKTSKRLNEDTLSDRVYGELLGEIDAVIGTQGGTICLSNQVTQRQYRLATTRVVAEGVVDICGSEKCEECFGGDSAHLLEMMRDGDNELRVVATPIRDQERQFGVLMTEISAGRHLEEWQIRLLEAVANQIGVALNIARRGVENRRLALFEERGTIARELHDSLAQSLSYLKIQVSRLDSLLVRLPHEREARLIVGELREGLNSAYRQLRELLTTFRLKMDGRGLASALDDTVREFTERSGVTIHLDNALIALHLSANEELHVLQVVREALSNVVRHSQATQAIVTLARRASGDVEVRIDDNGIGIDEHAERKHHYGLAIMQERSSTLHGKLTYSERTGGGTRVELVFTPGAMDKQMHNMTSEEQ